MQVSVESLSQIERRVKVIVPVEKLDQAFDARIAKLSKTAKVKGFRPGKVPLSIVKQQYGDSARQEALSEVIQTSLYAAMAQEKLNAVSTPKVEPLNMMPGQPLEFSATFEILPVIDQVKFDVTAIEKETSTIQEEDILKVIEHLSQQHTSWKKVERPAQEKDKVFIDFLGKIDGVAFSGGQAHDYPIVLGSNTMIPGFEEGIIGKSAGEEVTVDVTFPENYFAKEVAGKVAQFTIKVLRVLQAELPELNDQFVKKLGVKTGLVDDLHTEIRKNLERELARLIKGKLKAQVFNKMLEQNNLDVPRAMVEREASRIHDELHPHHKGHDHGHSENEMAVFNQAAKRNVALGLLVGALIRQHDLMPDQERVKSLVETLSAAYENPEEVSKWYATNANARKEVEMQILEEQVMEKLLENVKVTEKSVSYGDFVKSVQAANVG